MQFFPLLSPGPSNCTAESPACCRRAGGLPPSFVSSTGRACTHVCVPCGRALKRSFLRQPTSPNSLSLSLAHCGRWTSRFRSRVPKEVGRRLSHHSFPPRPAEEEVPAPRITCASATEAAQPGASHSRLVPPLSGQTPHRRQRPAKQTTEKRAIQGTEAVHFIDHQPNSAEPSMPYSERESDRGAASESGNPQSGSTITRPLFSQLEKSHRCWRGVRHLELARRCPPRRREGGRRPALQQQRPSARSPPPSRPPPASVASAAALGMRRVWPPPGRRPGGPWWPAGFSAGTPSPAAGRPFAGALSPAPERDSRHSHNHTRSQIIPAQREAKGGSERTHLGLVVIIANQKPAAASAGVVSPPLSVQDVRIEVEGLLFSFLVAASMAGQHRRRVKRSVQRDRPVEDDCGRK